MNSSEINKTEKFVKMAIEQRAPDTVFKSKLRARLVSSSNQEIPTTQPLLSKLRPAFATLAILIIAAVIFSNPRIVKAIRSIFYFIPGIGLTELNANNYVVDPVEPTIIEGVSFRVSNGVSTKEGITLLLEIKGLSAEMLFTPDETFRFPEVEYKLNLDEKHSLDLTEKSSRWDGVSGYQIRLVFPLSSERLGNAYLWLSHTPFANPDLSPNNIEVPIKFSLFTDPSGVLPVVDIQSPIPTPLISVSVGQVSPTEALPTDPTVESPASTQESQYWIEVLRMVHDVDGSILMGRIYWTEDLPKMPRFSPLAVELRDSNGSVIPLAYYQVQDDIPLQTDTWLPWGLKTNQPLGRGSYTLSFSGLTVRRFTNYKIEIPANIASDPSMLENYVLTANIDGVEMSLTDITFGNTTTPGYLFFTVDSKYQVESLTLSHEKLTNMNVSQLDTNRFTVEAEFSSVIEISNGSLIITSIDYHLSEPVETDFQVP